MSIFVISDLHLSISTPEKTMEVFGEKWIRYQDKIRENWLKSVSKDDLVLIPGDISWAMSPERARLDLEWIDSLPGKKLLLKGNHDYWWSSLAKLKKILPPSIFLLQNDAFLFNEIAIAGARLWDCREISYQGIALEYSAETSEEEKKKQEAIFARELIRLEMSLKAMKSIAKIKVAMTHYPPLGPNLASTQVTELFEKYGISIAVFGHLHGLSSEDVKFGQARGIHYFLTSADYLDFTPLKIF